MNPHPDPMMFRASPPMSPPSEISVRHLSGKLRRRSVPQPTAVGSSICRFLTHLHPRATADQVAADLCAWGVKAGTIAKMLERRSTPSGWLMLALTCAYGPELLCAALPEAPDWLDAAQRARAQRALEDGIAAQQRALDALRRP